MESNINPGRAVPEQQMIIGIGKESGINNSSFLMVPLNFSTSNITSWLAEFWTKEKVGFHPRQDRLRHGMTRYASKES